MANGIRLEKVTENYAPIVTLSFLDDYAPREPLNKHVQPFDGMKDIIRRKVDLCVKHGISVVALDKSGKPAGFLICNKCLSDGDLCDTVIAQYTEYGAVSTFLRSFLKDVDVRAELGTKLGHACDLCVAERHTGKGLGQKLLSQAMKFAVEAGLEGFFAECTSETSRHIFEKLGCRELSKKSMADFSYNGTKPFASLSGFTYLMGRQFHSAGSFKAL